VLAKLLAILLVPGKLGYMKAVGHDQASEQLPELVRRAGMSYEMFARALSVSRRSVGMWLAGEEPGRLNRVRIYEFRRLVEALCKVIKPEKLGAWWERPAPNFGGSTPLQVLERGEADRLWRMVWEIRAGNSGD
jgi:hypothetical protein